MNILNETDIIKTSTQNMYVYMYMYVCTFMSLAFSVSPLFRSGNWQSKCLEIVEI